MYLSILFFPLFASLSAGLAGRFLGRSGAAIITTFSLFLSASFSFIAFYEVGLLGSPTYIHFGNWIDSELFSIHWGFLFDSLTVVMLLVVSIVSFLVHLYSFEYMSHDPHLPRFMSYLSLFTFFMLILVSSDNLIQLFIGWEGVGLSSYLLINFWFTRIQANKAAIKAIILNRIGDFGLSIGIFILYYVFKTLDFSTIFALAPAFINQDIIFFTLSFDQLTLLSFFFFLGAIGKSAQIGLHTWLPDAMEGPTPVSALIHAATMVTAGVFLMIRCSPILEYAPNTLIFISFIGAFTAFFAATIGLVMNDIKRVIAYSTCSQLGYMVFACGLSNYSLSLFHLTNHAFFKALLFLSAGSVIHALRDEQDMRKMGSLIHFIPFTYSMFLIASLSILGFPFMTGFFSKDSLLEISFAHFSIPGSIAHWLGTITAFLTAFYSFRLIYLTFINQNNSTLSSLHGESSFFMSFPLILLAFGSIFLGWFIKDMFIGLGTDFWNNSIFILPKNFNLIDSEFIPTFIKLIPVFLSLLGAILAIIIYHFFFQFLILFHFHRLGRFIYNFLNQKWFFDLIYNSYILQNLFNFSYNITSDSLDRGIFQLIGPYGIGLTLKRGSVLISQLQSGFLYHYAFFMFLGLTFLLTFTIFPIFKFIDITILFLFIITIIFPIFNSHD